MKYYREEQFPSITTGEIIKMDHQQQLLQAWKEYVKFKKTHLQNKSNFIEAQKLFFLFAKTYALTEVGQSVYTTSGLKENFFVKRRQDLERASISLHILQRENDINGRILMELTSVGDEFGKIKEEIDSFSKSLILLQNKIGNDKNYCYKHVKDLEEILRPETLVSLGLHSFAVAVLVKYFTGSLAAAMPPLAIFFGVLLVAYGGPKVSKASAQRYAEHVSDFIDSIRLAGSYISYNAKQAKGILIGVVYRNLIKETLHWVEHNIEKLQSLITSKLKSVISQFITDLIKKFANTLKEKNLPKVILDKIIAFMLEHKQPLLEMVVTLLLTRTATKHPEKNPEIKSAKGIELDNFSLKEGSEDLSHLFYTRFDFWNNQINADVENLLPEHGHSVLASLEPPDSCKEISLDDVIKSQESPPSLLFKLPESRMELLDKHDSIAIPGLLPSRL